MEHLACFAPGMIALGVARGAGQLSPDEAANHTRLATQLAETCWRLYADTPTGLAPPAGRSSAEISTRGFPEEFWGKKEERRTEKELTKIRSLAHAPTQAPLPNPTLPPGARQPSAAPSRPPSSGLRGTCV